MSERLHERVTKSYTSPSRETSLRKPAMRLSPRKITSPRNYRMPPKRLDSPDVLKQYQNRIQEKLNNQITTSDNKNLTYYNSPLKPKIEDKMISSSFPSLVPIRNSTMSPKREIPIDLSPIRGKNIISKLKQEMSKIEALDRNKKNNKINKRSELKKSVRFNVTHPTKVGEDPNTIQNETIPHSGLNIPIELVHTELSDIKKMLTLVIKKQEAHDLLLNDIVTKLNKLEENMKTNRLKEETEKTEI